MHRSIPYFARFKDLLGLRFGKKVKPTETARNESATEKEIDEEQEQQVESDVLKARGVLKYIRPYDPPVDVEDQLINIVRKSISSSQQITENQSLLDLRFVEHGGNELKFRIFSEAEELLGKRIPSSNLHEMKTVSDLVKFYRIPVKNITSYSDMSRSKNLPKNLHISVEAKRFHPLTDGETAFPGRSTYVTDLRQRQFFTGFRAKKEWHHYQDKHFDCTKTPPECPWNKKKAERCDTMSSLKAPNFPR